MSLLSSSSSPSASASASASSVSSSTPAGPGAGPGASFLNRAPASISLPSFPLVHHSNNNNPQLQLQLQFHNHSTAGGSSSSSSSSSSSNHGGSGIGVGVGGSMSFPTFSASASSSPLSAVNSVAAKSKRANKSAGSSPLLDFVPFTPAFASQSSSGGAHSSVDSLLHSGSSHAQSRKPASKRSRSDNDDDDDDDDDDGSGGGGSPSASGRAGEDNKKERLRLRHNMYETKRREDLSRCFDALTNTVKSHVEFSPPAGKPFRNYVLIRGVECIQHLASMVSILNEENQRLQKRLNELDHLNLIISDPPLFLDPIINLDLAEASGALPPTSATGASAAAQNDSTVAGNSNAGSSDDNAMVISATSSNVSKFSGPFPLSATVSTPVMLGLNSVFFSATNNAMRLDHETGSLLSAPPASSDSLGPSSAQSSGDAAAGYKRASFSGLLLPGGAADEKFVPILPHNGKLYVFEKEDSGYPASLTNGRWPGLPLSGIDAAIMWGGVGKRKCFVFHDKYFTSYDIEKNCADAGYPQVIAQSWPQLKFDKIDGAVNWGNGKVYFFSGAYYLRYDIATETADEGYPRLIPDGQWDEMVAMCGYGPISMRNVKWPILWDNGKAYLFFKNGTYARYDMSTLRVTRVNLSDWTSSRATAVASSKKAINSTEVVASWLESIELSEYIPLFRKEKITFAVLQSMTDDELRSLGVEAFGARKRILSASQEKLSTLSSYV